MTIDGFLQFLGLVVAVYALFSVVIRYRLRLHGWLLWFPTTAVLVAVVYLLLFDLLGVGCNSNWCASLRLSEGEGFTPSKLAFIIILLWLAYISALFTRTSTSKRQLPLLASLVDRLVAERRFPELIDFVEPHIKLMSRCASRQFPLQKFCDRARWHGNPYLFNRPRMSDLTAWERTKLSAEGFFLRISKPLVRRLPEKTKAEEAALRILRVLYANERVVEFLALERPQVALKLMDTRAHDYDFSDRAFEIMMAHPESDLRRETLLNQNVGRCFYEIDPSNPLIHALFADSEVANRLQVWRPVGNYPLRLLERNEHGYRETISAAKPQDDQLLIRDPAYVMTRFFDIMVRSAMRDGIEWHMWLFYFDLLVDKILKSMNRSHPDYDPTAEFPNLGYFIIYEVFDLYGQWLSAIECCREDSPAVQIERTSPQNENGSIAKSTMISMGNSLKHLIESDADDRLVAYIIEVVMRDYRNLKRLPNGARLQETLRNSLIARGAFGKEPHYGRRLRECYDQIDHAIRFDTQDFETALVAAYP